MKGIWIVLSECDQCRESNLVEKVINKENPDITLFGHIRAIVDSEEEAKRLVKHYDEKYKSIGNMNIGFTHFYKEWTENEQ